MCQKQIRIHERTFCTRSIQIIIQVFWISPKLRGLDVSLQPIRGDLILHAWHYSVGFLNREWGVICVTVVFHERVDYSDLVWIFISLFFFSNFLLPWCVSYYPGCANPDPTIYIRFPATSDLFQIWKSYRWDKGENIMSHLMTILQEKFWKGHWNKYVRFWRGGRRHWS